MRRLAIGCALALTLSTCQHRAFFDQFTTDGYLDPGYRWFDEGRADRYEVAGGQLKITASRGEDLWGGAPIKRGAPIMLRPAPFGDYDVESVVDARFGGVPQYINTQTGLFVFEDVENWLFFGFTSHSSQGGPLPNGNGLIVTKIVADVSSIAHYQSFAADFAKLKIQRSGNQWRFYYELGGAWLQAGPSVSAQLGEHEVGMGVKSFRSGGAAGKGTFDDFRITVR